jgi:DNA-binding NtrC family response regulator
MKTTILFLASDAAIRNVICQTLESEGYVVLPASNIGTAVDLLKKCIPDLLMIRHYTSSISGHDAAMYLRRTHPGIPVLLVGGLLDDESLENREILQGFEMFPKPFTASDLLKKVKEVLAKQPNRKLAAGNSE